MKGRGIDERRRNTFLKVLGATIRYTHKNGINKIFPILFYVLLLLNYVEKYFSPSAFSAPYLLVQQ